MITWEILIPEKEEKKLYFEILKEKVIDSGLCSRCLTCACVCPVDGIGAYERVDFPEYDKKCRDCGACVRVCPRFDYRPKYGMGDYLEFIGARSKRFSGQDGAMVTEFMISAIELDLIDRALFVGRDEEWRPEIFHLRDSIQLEIGGLTGTKYTFATVLSELKDAVKFTRSGVGVVGTPCIVSGVRALQREFPLFRDRVRLLVGLFCTENFHYDELMKFLGEKGVEVAKLVKTDITKGKFIATMTDGEIKFKVKELEEILPSGCSVCTDFTAVESDVSVGSVGSNPGFSTVVVRQENARAVLNYIRDKGYAEFGEAKPSQLDFLINYKVGRFYVEARKEENS
ncbi:MAG: Coenzyme F420 hydrogenase/dehydrogenase, beta subunit C-terminal domain [Candidatus Syntropharchaeia archaeon]